MRVIDVSIKWRLLAALAVPLVATASLAGVEVLSAIRDYSQADNMVSVAAEIGHIGDLVHDLQVERGLTAGFLGSKGTKNKDALQAARTNTTQETQAVVDVLAQISLTDTVLAVEAEAVSADLEKLAQNRAGIDGLALTGPEAFAYYTASIADLMTLAQDYSLLHSPEGTANALVAHGLIMNAKELAGQERGMGNGFITAGAFDPKRFMAFVGLGGAQRELIAKFLKLMPPEQRDSYQKTLAGDGLSQLEEFRQQLIAGGISSSLSGLDAGAWFALATKQIDLMKQVETAVVEAIAADAATRADAAWWRLMIVGGSVLAGFVLTISFASSLSYTVIRPIGMLTEAVERLSRDEIDVHLIHSEGNDEVGRMGQAIRHCVANSKAKAERERDEQEKIEADKRARERAAEQERAERAAEIAYAVGELAAGLAALARGETNYRAQHPFAGELERLRTDFNNSMSTLHSVVETIAQSSDTIKSGSDELRSSADELAQRTERQAAALEQASASLSEVTSNLAQSSKRAESVGNLVQTTAADAMQSGTVVANTVEAISQIEQSSGQIGQIISVIDEIAFQTNLLALNAGVEAARAGEAGKGFAVVAQEVRELAQRSATAAREIKALIQRSSKEVQLGVELVGETGRALRQIEANVSRINQDVVEIVRASREQSASITEINAAMNQMDQVTQQNAAMVEEATAATHSLGTEAHRLSEQVDIFRSGGRKEHGRRAA
ncbi:methyl-accepting chemotaxis protein [Rhizobium sp. AG855]|uniref:methyl-accepting chemotaxis protein n=1 Tax=Rhizobium sp. AG855 TaxID=2183898 RepID=UPI000E745B4E|nr:methyl-accepting chemotaxis protein [Rhizobium sp. AG855]RKE85340.1 methyl-accepting chemotaxis protein [Rhizobium sp. AG855]